MRKLFFLALLLTLPFFTYSQVKSKKLAVGNGGVFSFSGPGPRETQSTFGVLEEGNYKSIDTIGATSVQNVITDGRFAYAAFEDSIIKYDLINEKRIGFVKVEQTGFYGTTLGISDFYLIVGSDNGINSNLKFFNKSSLTLDFSVSKNEIENYIDGIYVVKDSAYIVHNKPKKSQTWVDSVAYLSIIDLSKKEVVRTIRLGEGVAGLSELFYYKNHLLGLGAGQVFKYNITDGSFKFVTVPASRLLGVSKNYLYAIMSKSNGKSGIGRILLDEIHVEGPDTVIVESSKYEKPYLADATVDSVNSSVYLSSTNYDSTVDSVFNFDNTGSLLVKDIVGISPEAIDVAYNSLPVARNDTFYVTIDSYYEADILLNDEDQDDEIIGISIITAPENGKVQITETDKISYVPDIGFTGEDSVQYAIFDVWGDFSIAYAHFRVESVTSTYDMTDLSFEAFPNPCNNLLTINLPEGEGTYVLIDMDGTVVSSGRVFNNNTIEVGKFEKGVYVLKVKTDTGAYVSKIVKE